MLWLHSLKVAQLLRSAACLHTNQSRSYLNHLVEYMTMRGPLSVKSGFIYFSLVFHGSTAPSGPGTPRCRGFTTTHSHTTLDRTTPDKWSVRCTDLYLTTHNTLRKQTFMTPAGFEPAISASDGPQIKALARAAS